MTTFTKSTLALSAIATLSSTHAIAQHQHHQHTPPPIGIMGSHMHSKGEWMVTLRHMSMNMEQLFSGTNTVPSNMASTGYMMSSTSMRMEMDMLGIMWAPADKLTLMLMSSHQEKSMKMANAAGIENSSTSVSGIGDTSITALYSLYKGMKSNAHIGLSLSLPTGATDKKITSSPMPPAIGRDLPFGMQFGSGTYDFTPSVTYTYRFSHCLSLGTQLRATLRSGVNDEGYRIGNNIETTTWISHRAGEHFSFSGRVSAKFTSGIHGSQTNGLHTLNPIMSLPADPSNSGGTTINLFIGANYRASNGIVTSLEIGKPIYQDLNGIQMANDYSINLGLRYAW